MKAKEWTENEFKKLKSLANKKTIRELSEIFGVTKGQLQYKLKKEKIIKKRTLWCKHRWTKGELKKLKNIINDYTNKQLAKIFNVTEVMLIYKLRQEKIKRTSNIKPVKIMWRVDKKTGCWICTSHTKSVDRPIFTRGKKVFSIVRVMYEKEKGKIPKGMVIRHTCDRKDCINPSHMVLGHPKDNHKIYFEKLKKKGLI